MSLPLWILQSANPLLHRTPQAPPNIFLWDCICFYQLLDEVSLDSQMKMMLDSGPSTFCNHDKLQVRGFVAGFKFQSFHLRLYLVTKARQFLEFLTPSLLHLSCHYSLEILPHLEILLPIPVFFPLFSTTSQLIPPAPIPPSSSPPVKSILFLLPR